MDDAQRAQQSRDDSSQLNKFLMELLAVPMSNKNQASLAVLDTFFRSLPPRVDMMDDTRIANIARSLTIDPQIVSKAWKKFKNSHDRYGRVLGQPGAPTAKLPKLKPAKVLKNALCPLYVVITAI